MTDDELAWKFAVPDWAIDANDAGTLVVGRQLCTRDGRHCGNAHIIKREISELHKIDVYTVLTDAGTYLYLSTSEVHELFHIGTYISDASTVVKRFSKES